MKFENSKTMPRMATLLAVVLAFGLTLQAADNDPDFKNTCFRPLVETYSLEGIDKPEELGMKMCNSIRRTCCQVKDQETIYTNWIHGKEEANIQDRYNNNSKVYGELIQQLKQVAGYATDVKGVIVKKISNCKLLAERILNFEVNQVEVQVLKNLEEMKKFFVTSYKGFYCAICNHDNHRFFKKDAQTIVFSEKFCRDIVEKTLPSLLIFHVDIIKLLNLVTKFVTSCDIKGEYNLESTFPKDLIFGQSKEVVNSLRSCRDNRNKKEWFSYCKEVCMNFQLVQYPKYFEPNVPEIAKYNIFLKAENKRIAAEKALNPQMFSSATPAPGQPKAPGALRILQDQKDGKEKTTIYTPGLSPKVMLDSWKRDFAEEGISLYDEGGNSNVSESTFNTVKTDLQLARDGSSTQASAMLTTTEQEMLKKAGKRELAGVSIMQGIGLALGFLYLSW